MMAELRKISTMTSNEIGVLNDLLDQSHRYLEFGMGASTRLACQKESIQCIDVVESSPDYASMIEAMHTEIRDAKDSGKLRLHLIDIGATKAWGFPVNDSCQDRWRHYPESVHNLEGGWDTVLVDGRFRVACVVNVLLCVDPSCRILIHDFWNRNSYHVVLNYLDVVCSVDTLGVFRKRPDCRESELEVLRVRYQNCVT